MTPLQEQMLSELQSKKLFKQAQEYAFHYLDTAPERNIYPTEEALANLRVFEEPMPRHGTDPTKVLEQLNTYASPANVIQIYGRYFGFVNGSSLPVSLAAKQLSTFWDQNTAMFAQSPAAARLEGVVEKWLQSIFNLPEGTAAGFVSGTSPANICALAAARWRLFKNQGWDFNENGFENAPRIRIVAGREAHSSVIKSICLLGFGKKQIEFVDVDNEGRIIPESLPPLDNSTLLILQAGNVNSGSFDYFSKICGKAREAGAWIHIDGAFGLWAAASNRLKHLTQGIELAHSWAVDGHKTLNTPYDSGIVLCADREALTTALQASGDYFVISKERDGMFYSPEMSRRARIFEIWAALKYLGCEGLDQMIYTMHERATQFATQIGQIPGFRVANEVVFNQVLVACDDDEQTSGVLKNIQDQRECWVGGSTWRGKKVIRVSVCSWVTTEQDIDRSVQSFAKAAKQLPVL
jgi:glutamate/tyrosine decarboxylase-like PLP-dependent enzyme